MTESKHYCPVRAKIIADLWQEEPDQVETLCLIAFLRMYVLEVTEKCRRELWSSKSPLPIVAAIMSDYPTIRDHAIACYGSRLPHLDENLACATVSRRWPVSDLRSQRAYWMWRWDQNWTYFGDRDCFDNDTQERFAALVDRFDGHHDVSQVIGPRKSVTLTRCTWDWRTELKSLPLDYAVGFAVRNALRVLPAFVEHFGRGAAPNIMDAVHKAQSFVAGRDQLLIDVDWPKGSVTDTADYVIAAAPIGCAIAAARELRAYLDVREIDHAYAALEHAAASCLVCSSEDFVKLLELSCVQFPELGGPIDVSESGPLGTLIEAQDNPK
jgi:hypothetical protein